MTRAAYRPPFTITASLLTACAETMRLLGRVEGLPGATPRLRLRRQSRARSVQSTLAIEGAGLDELAVTALLEGKHVPGGLREVREVQNAIEAYSVSRLRPDRVKDLLTAHRTLMGGLVPDAGRFRRGGVGVIQGSRIAHVAPPASRVPHLVEELLDFVRRDKEVHPLLRAAMAHYDVEFIHPFSDGNGPVALDADGEP